MPGLNLDASDTRSHALALYLGGRCKILRADEVGSGFLPPGDLARRLSKRLKGLSSEPSGSTILLHHHSASRTQAP